MYSWSRKGCLLADWLALISFFSIISCTELGTFAIDNCMSAAPEAPVILLAEACAPSLFYTLDLVVTDCLSSICFIYDSGSWAPRVDVSRSLRLLLKLIWDCLFSCEPLNSSVTCWVGTDPRMKVDPRNAVVLSCSYYVKVFLLDIVFWSLSLPTTESSLKGCEKFESLPVFLSESIPWTMEFILS